MCDACSKASWNVNPEPDQVALARYARLVDAQALPKPGMLPKWLKAHLKANYVKPFAPDFSMPPIWPWSEGFREPPNREPDSPIEFVSLWKR